MRSWWWCGVWWLRWRPVGVGWCGWRVSRGLGSRCWLGGGWRRGWGCRLFWGWVSGLELVPLRARLEGWGVGGGWVDAVRAPLAGWLRGGGWAGVATPRDVAAMLAEQVLVLVDRLCGAGPVVLVL